MKKNLFIGFLIGLILLGCAYHYHEATKYKRSVTFYEKHDGTVYFDYTGGGIVGKDLFIGVEDYEGQESFVVKCNK